MCHRPIVLIRGLFRDHRFWGDFAGQMQATFPHRQVLQPDLAGTGMRNRLTSPNSITDMVTDLREQVRQQLNHFTGIELVGLSMGGMIAIEWARRYPSEVRHAVLINTSTGSLSGFYNRLRWQQYPTILRSLSGNVETEEKIIYQLSSNSSINKNILEQWINWSTDYPIRAISRYNQLIASARYRCADKPKVPMLILASPMDKMVSPSCSFRLAKHWDLPIKTHVSAGHDIPLEDPDWVCGQIRDYLAKEGKIEENEQEEKREETPA